VGSLTVTATQIGTGAQNGMVLTVKVITGQAASPIGATASSRTVAARALAITPSATGSQVYGAIVDGTSSTAFTALAASTPFTQNVSDATHGVVYGTFRSTATTTAGTPVTLGASGTATSGQADIALCEILAAGTLAEDASSPAVAHTTVATTLSTASFSPPPGSLLVAMVSTDEVGSNPVSVTMTGGGLTWTQQVFAGNVSGGTLYAAVWTAVVPAGVPARKGPAGYQGRQALPRRGRVSQTYVVADPPTIVQTKTGTANAATLTVTLTGGTTAGNGLVVALAFIGTTANPTGATITLGGAGGFTNRIIEGSGSSTVMGTGIWVAENIAGGQTAVAITLTGAGGTPGMFAYVYEVHGIVTTAGASIDKIVGTVKSTASTAWTSGASATTTAATEAWIGIGGVAAGAAITQTGPASPWANLANQTGTLAGASCSAISGSQITTTTGTCTYAGTISVSELDTACAVTLLPGGAALAPVSPQPLAQRTFRRRLPLGGRIPVRSHSGQFSGAGPKLPARTQWPVTGWRARFSKGRVTASQTRPPTVTPVTPAPLTAPDGPTAARRQRPRRGFVTRTATPAAVAAVVSTFTGLFPATPAVARPGLLSPGDPGPATTAGPVLYPRKGPVRAAVPRATWHGHAQHGAGTFAGTGPPLRPAGSPANQAPPVTGWRATFSRGRVTASRVTPPVPTPAPLYPQEGPQRAPLPRAATLHGRSLSRAGTFSGAGPVLRPGNSPAGQAPPVTAWRQAYSKGRVSASKPAPPATAPLTPAPLRPLAGPVRAPQPVPPAAASGCAAAVTGSPPVAGGGTLALRAASTASTGATAGGAAPLNFTIPAGTQPGDILVIWCFAGTSSVISWTAPGWTAVTVTSGANGACQILWRVATGAEGAPVTVTCSAPQQWAGVIAGYSGENTASPFDPAPASGQINASSTVVAAASITTTKPGDRLLWFGAIDAGSGGTPAVLTVPAGFTAEVTQVSTSAASGTNVGVIYGDATQGSAGATGAKNGTAASGHANGAALISITPGVTVPGALSSATGALSRYGRVFSSAGTFTAVTPAGPALTAQEGPVTSRRLPLTRGGQVHRGAGTFSGSGPALTPLDGPSRAKLPRQQPQGTATHPAALLAYGSNARFSGGNAVTWDVCLHNGTPIPPWWTVTWGSTEDGGCTRITDDPAGARAGVLEHKPQASTSSGQTFSALTAGPSLSGSFTWTIDMRTVAQLRTGSAPNNWETAWVFWYLSTPGAGTSGYYYTIKEAGTEFGRLNNGTQVILATTSNNLNPGNWHTVHVAVTGTTHAVAVDGTTDITFTDSSAQALGSGQVACYCEDSQVHFSDWAILSGTSGPPVTAQDGPARTRQPVLPFSRGRAVASRLAAPVTPAPLYPQEGPVRIPPPGPVLHGRATGIRHTGTLSASGPALTAHAVPAAAPRPQPALHGRVAGIRHGGALPTSGTPLTPMAGPARAKLPPLPVLRGRGDGSGGAFAFTARPPVPQSTSGPVAARQPLPRRHPVLSGGAAFAGHGPVLYPLQQPARSRVPAVFSRGRVTRTPAYVPPFIPPTFIGPVLYPLQQPAGLARRAPGPVLHGRAQGRRGTFTPSGPALTAQEGPVQARLPLQPVLRGRGSGSRGTSAFTAKPPKPQSGPVAARQPLPRRHPVLSGSGTPAGRGPALTPLTAPVRARVPATFSRGRVTRTPRYVLPVITPAPLYAAGGPARAKLPVPVLRGRAATRAGTSVPSGPALYPQEGPVVLRRPLPPRGRITASLTHPPFIVTGAVLYPQEGPARAQILPLSPHGRTRTSRPAVITPAPLYPATGPRRAPLPPPSLHGRVQGHAGVFSGTGPRVAALTQPARTRLAAPPLRGRVTATRLAVAAVPGPHPAASPANQVPSAVTAWRAPFSKGRVSASKPAGSPAGPPLYPHAGPARAPLPAAALHGRAQGRRGTFSGSGPSVRALAGPVQARRPLPPSGRVSRRAGTFSGAGPAVRALAGPVTARRPQPTRTGRGPQSGPGTYSGTGPRVRALPGPVQARRPLPPRGKRWTGDTGTIPQFPPPPAALTGPVHICVTAAGPDITIDGGYPPGPPETSRPPRTAWI
jgi:hypothetical protein